MERGAFDSMAGEGYDNIYRRASAGVADPGRGGEARMYRGVRSADYQPVVGRSGAVASCRTIYVDRQVIPTALEIDRCPLPRSDGPDPAWIVGEPVPCVGAGRHNLVVAIPDTSGEFVGPQVIPNILH